MNSTQCPIQRMPPCIQQSAIKFTGGKSERQQPPLKCKHSIRDMEMSSPPPPSPPAEMRELIPRRVKVVKPPPKPKGDVSQPLHIYYTY